MLTIHRKSVMTKFGPIPISKMDKDIYDCFVGITEGLKTHLGYVDFNTILINKEEIHFCYKTFGESKKISEVDSKIKDLIIYMIDKLYKD